MALEESLFDVVREIIAQENEYTMVSGVVNQAVVRLKESCTYIRFSSREEAVLPQICPMRIGDGLELYIRKRDDVLVLARVRGGPCYFFE